MLGARKTVAPDVLRHMLAALGLPCATRGDVLASRKRLQRRATLQALPPLITATAGRPTRLDVGASEPRIARLSLKRAVTRDVLLSPVRGRLRVPPISRSGYHRLLIDDREFVLAVAPSRCWTLDDAVPDARLWGIAAQVYSLRHRGDGGIGDAAGIAALAEAAGSRGADAIWPEPAACVVRRRSVALRSLFALDAPVPQSFARIRGAGVRRGACGGHAGRRGPGRDVRPA